MRRVCICRRCDHHMGACPRDGAPTRCIPCQRAKWRQRQRTRDPGPLRVYSSGAWKALASAVVEAASACHWCGTSASLTKLTADHIHSVAEHPALGVEPSNVVAACLSCQNKRRFRPDVSQWPAHERQPRTWRGEA